MAPLLDALPQVVGTGALELPLHGSGAQPEELPLFCAENLRIQQRECAFLPVLGNRKQARLAFAYTRADGSIGVLLSDTEIRTWLAELKEHLVSRPLPPPPAPSLISDHPPSPRAAFGDIETRSPGFARTLRHVSIVGPGDADLMLLGETGTGKEHMARAIHAASARRDGPFVAVNCALETADLIESHLFGHVRGAFTGAVTARKGKFLEADGGTLLLDELGDSSLKFQLALLRVLETRRITPVGGDSEVKINVRVLSATSRDLKQLLVVGKFREDLYFRLVGGEVTMPPLRQRLEDVPALAATLLSQMPGAPTLDASALEVLTNYAWPGNVRELIKALQAAAHKAAAEAALAAQATANTADASNVEHRAAPAPLVLRAEHLDLVPSGQPRANVPEAPIVFSAETKGIAAQIWSHRALRERSAYGAATSHAGAYQSRRRRAAVRRRNPRHAQRRYPPTLGPQRQRTHPLHQPARGHTASANSVSIIELKQLLSRTR